MLCFNVLKVLYSVHLFSNASIVFLTVPVIAALSFTAEMWNQTGIIDQCE